MIGKLKGVVDEIGEDHLVLDVHNVGYVVHCGARTLAGLPGAGEAVTLYIETHVREDQIRLYGFASALEREWFRLLQVVQGVGAKVALAVLSVLSPAELGNAIALRDIATITRAPGVGKKVAERIVTELKSKAPILAPDELTGFRQDIGAGTAPGAITDAVSALVNLGYGRDQAASAVAAAVKHAGDGAPAATLIRLGLKELSQ